MASIQVIAHEASAAIKEIMKFEPTAAGIASAVIPGAAPVVALVQPEILLIAPAIEKAMDDLAAGNGGNAAQAVLEIIMHLSKGLPNSPVLSPAADAPPVVGNA